MSLSVSTESSQNSNYILTLSDDERVAQTNLSSHSPSTFSLVKSPSQIFTSQNCGASIKRSQTLTLNPQLKFDTLTSRANQRRNSILNLLNEETVNELENSISTPSSSSPSDIYSCKENVFTNGSISFRNTQSFRRGSSFRSCTSNENYLSEILKNQTNKPIPPNRSSSLQYKSQPQKQISNYKSSNTNCNNYEDRNSIYSSYSIRNYNMDSDYALYSNYVTLLTDMETSKIESCYQSIGSRIYSSKCVARLYITNLQNLISLNDWQHQVTAIPVWIFNTGLNPKRPKGLQLVFADKKTGFALWKSNPITYHNDFKWSRPGHITFKLIQNSQESLNTKKNCSKKIVKSRTSLFSEDSVSTIRQSASSNGIKYKERGLNESSLNCSNSFLFAAIKFEDEFECSKFYDFYRSLFVDCQNDDLFNPHYKPSLKSNIIKVFYKKITKNSISSPVAFNHINSLSILAEEPVCNFRLSSTQDLSNSNSSDTQSMVSDLTVTSHNNSSFFLNKRK